MNKEVKVVDDIGLDLDGSVEDAKAAKKEAARKKAFHDKWFYWKIWFLTE